MARGSHMAVRPAPRSGVPLARAQRLAARPRGRTASRRPLGGLLAGLSAVALMAGAYVVPQTDRAAMVLEAPTLERAALAAPPPAGPPCVGQVERTITDLRTSQDPAAQGAGVANLVRVARSCPAYGLVVEGSLELARIGLADIRLGWWQADRKVRLAVVDPVPPGTQPDAGDAPVSFVIR